MTVTVSDEQIQKWNREIALIRLTDACPYCDGPIDLDMMENPNGDRVADFECQDCHDQWIALVAELPGSFKSEYRVS